MKQTTLRVNGDGTVARQVMMLAVRLNIKVNGEFEKVIQRRLGARNAKLAATQMEVSPSNPLEYKVTFPYHKQADVEQVLGAIEKLEQEIRQAQYQAGLLKLVA